VTAALIPIEHLNRASRQDFAAGVRPLFEAAAPLAHALYARRPFASYEELIQRAEALANELSLPEQVELINAHPRIGERADRLSALSQREQGGTDPPELIATLAELNQIYEQRVGFRFVIFVNRRPKAEIVNVLRHRMNNPREQELATALGELFLIARDRLRFLAHNAVMQQESDNAARLAVLEELRRAALATYGEDRAAEAALQNALKVAATAVWRVSEEPLEPLGPDPLPTHD
jgi:2-oxo-4-hydroxy-4-carboxy-5-ureidoimidazoline decarboxylase